MPAEAAVPLIVTPEFFYNNQVGTISGSPDNKGLADRQIVKHLKEYSTGRIAIAICEQRPDALAVKVPGIEVEFRSMDEGDNDTLYEQCKKTFQNNIDLFYGPGRVPDELSTEQLDELIDDAPVDKAKQLLAAWVNKNGGSLRPEPNQPDDKWAGGWVYFESE